MPSNASTRKHALSAPRVIKSESIKCQHPARNKDRNNNSQYALIKNLSHVVRLCYSKCRSQHFFCPYGLYEYMSQEKLNKKMDICKRRGTQQIQAGNLLLMPYCLEANRTPWRQRF